MNPMTHPQYLNHLVTDVPADVQELGLIASGCQSNEAHALQVWACSHGLWSVGRSHWDLEDCRFFTACEAALSEFIDEVGEGRYEIRTPSV